MVPRSHTVAHGKPEKLLSINLQMVRVTVLETALCLRPKRSGLPLTQHSDCKLVDPVGNDPTTFGLKARCSGQLSYESGNLRPLPSVASGGKFVISVGASPKTRQLSEKLPNSSNWWRIRESNPGLRLARATCYHYHQSPNRCRPRREAADSSWRLSPS